MYAHTHKKNQFKLEFRVKRKEAEGKRKKEKKTQELLKNKQKTKKRNDFKNSKNISGPSLML